MLVLDAFPFPRWFRSDDDDDDVAAFWLVCFAYSFVESLVVSLVLCFRRRRLVFCIVVMMNSFACVQFVIENIVKVVDLLHFLFGLFRIAIAIRVMQ